MRDKKRGKKVVSSIIEHTTKSTAMKRYYKGVAELSDRIEREVCGYTDNLLSLKIALMEVVKRVEERLKENRRS